MSQSKVKIGSKEQEEISKYNSITCEYIHTSEFRTPYDLRKVYQWFVKWDILWVTPKEGDEQECFHSYCEFGDNCDFTKYPAGHYLCHGGTSLGADKEISQLITGEEELCEWGNLDEDTKTDTEKAYIEVSKP